MPAHLARDANGVALSPADIETMQRKHAETQQELEDTKRQLGQVSRRCIDLNEKAKRQLSGEAIDAVLQEAVDRERIWPDDVDEWRRKLEAP